MGRAISLTSKMSDNDYEVPLPFYDKSSIRHSSDEDFVDVRDLTKWTSENHLSVIPKCEGKNDNRFQHCLYGAGRRNTSPNDETNLRRSVSFASCHNNKINPEIVWNEKDDETLQTRSKPSFFQSDKNSSNASKSAANSGRSQSLALVVSVIGNDQANIPSFTNARSNLFKARSKSGDVRQEKSTEMKKTGMKEDKFNSTFRSHSFNSIAPSRVNLRDSAIDLVSDDENSEAYTAVSLAGTLSGKTTIPVPATRFRNRKLYIIIAVLSGIVLLLGGLGIGLALALFK